MSLIQLLGMQHGGRYGKDTSQCSFHSPLILTLTERNTFIEFLDSSLIGPALMAVWFKAYVVDWIQVYDTLINHRGIEL